MPTVSSTELTLSDLPSLQAYRKERLQIRDKAMRDRQVRRLNLGANVVLLFENKETMFYQVMEMLHIENKDSKAAREEELFAYAPLITDPNNIKATMQIEYPDSEERIKKLTLLRGIEDRMWFKVGDTEASYAVADEDMARSDDEKTSAVHFLRYPVSAAQQAALRAGEAVSFGCDHEHYRHQDALPAPNRQALVSDLQL